VSHAVNGSAGIKEIIKIKNEGQKKEHESSEREIVMAVASGKGAIRGKEKAGYRRVLQVTKGKGGR